MKINLTRSLSLVGLMLATSATTQANDIVDFLRAINGSSDRRSGPVVAQPVNQYGNRQPYRMENGDARFSNHANHNHIQPVSNRGNSVLLPGNTNLRPNRAISPPSRSGLQVRLQFASNGNQNPTYAPQLSIPPQPQFVQPQVPQQPPVYGYPSVPNYPGAQPFPPVAPAPATIGQYPIDQCPIGQFVHCQVPLATCVRIRNARRIAPNAVPMIIAVRDPNMCVHDVEERVVFVEVCVPPCPLLDLRVSNCHTRVTLDYGHHSVDIRSVRGMIVVDYNN